MTARRDSDHRDSASASEAHTDLGDDDEDEQPKFVSASDYDDRPVSVRPLTWKVASMLIAPLADSKAGQKGAIVRLLLVFTAADLALLLPQAAEEKRKKLAALQKWHHYDAGEETCTSQIKDEVLRALIQFGPISRNNDSVTNRDDDQVDDTDGVDVHAVTRKYDLQQLANDGRGGRLTFIFEMNQQAKVKEEVTIPTPDESSEAGPSGTTSAVASAASSPAAAQAPHNDDDDDDLNDDQAFHMDFDIIPDSQPGSPARSTVSDEV